MDETAVDIAIETEMVDTMVDQEKKSHESEDTKETATKRILASCEDTRQDIIWFVLWWVFRVFCLPSLHHQG
jgi:hypothetical protein